MKINFSKYQGTGNDFVMLDNRDGRYDQLSISQIQFLCDRKLGIGADGLIKINGTTGADFEVDYYNADGSKSFCGNGARCSVAFAKELGIIDEQTKFQAIDGLHSASIDEKEWVHLEMLPVTEIKRLGEDYFADTGSPHYIHFQSDSDPDIVTYGKKVRFSETFHNEGVNVNYIDHKLKGKIFVQTYERGVEDETLSCGTGVTACALVQMSLEQDLNEVSVGTKGGELKVKAKRKGEGFTDIWLMGPALKVFDGSIDI